MIEIIVPSCEEWDEISEQFIYSKEQKLRLEHSLVSISKWESKWNKPFLSKEAKSKEETVDYVRCMTINQNVDESVYRRLTNDNLNEINTYIEKPMTATTFRKERFPSGNGEIVTSEIIYYWIISLNIPFECQKWHLNRLLTLIKVCNIKNSPPKKMGKRDVMSRNSALNAARRKQLNTKG